MRFYLVLVASLFLSACEKVLDYTFTNTYFPDAVYAPLNLANGQTAILALGTNNLNAAGPGGLNATDLSSPSNVTISYDSKLIVSTSYRTAIWSSFPAVTYTPMSLVLGQNDKITNTITPGSAKFFWGPTQGTFYDGVHLWVADSMGHRILAYQPFPSADGSSAAFAVGQSILSGAPFAACARNRLSMPTDVRVAGGKLFVLDAGNNRLLIYNSVPTDFGALPDVVVGQPDFTTCMPMTSQTQLSTPYSFWTDGNRILIADTVSSRVLLWNSVPTTNGAPADVVLGQATFTGAGNAGGQFGMYNPHGVTSNGTQIFVADTDNHRILIYNNFPLVNTPAADGVIGQSNFSSTTSGSSSGSLNAPQGVAVNGSFLVVADTGNNRIMFYLTN